MTKIRYVAVIAIVGLFAILGAGYYFVLSPQKASAAKVHTNLTTQQAANGNLLKAHVELVSVAPGAPAPVTLLAPPVTAPAPTTPAAGSKTSAAPAPAAPAAPTTSALSAINVTMNIVGGYFAVQQFLTSLEASTRATVVTSVTMLPGVVPQPANAKGQSTAVSYKTLQTTVVATIYLSNTPPASATTVVRVSRRARRRRPVAGAGRHECTKAVGHRDCRRCGSPGCTRLRARLHRRKRPHRRIYPRG
jgi:hypothetical protein